MTTALAEAVEENVLSAIKNSKFVGLICDESCDAANFKQLIIYCNYMHKGISKASFVDICALNDGTADTILEAILKTIDKLEINKCNVVGIGTDGAAVMTGCKNGLAVKLQNSGVVYLMQIHCVAHRVFLSLSQPAKSIAIINYIGLALSQLHHFFMIAL